MNVLDYVKAFNEFLWNSFLMYALLGVGIFYTVYLGFPQIRHLNLAFKYAFGPIFKKRKPGETKVNSFQALATAVAAQVGTGNIGGVATAIASGGMGAIFWMWVSALLGMSTISLRQYLPRSIRKSIMARRLEAQPIIFIMDLVVSGLLFVFLLLLFLRWDSLEIWYKQTLSQ